MTTPPVAVQQEGQMMTAMTPLPPDAPAMVAWASFKDSEEYHNTRRWALDSNHVDGSLWAAFLQGHTTALAAKDEELAAVKAREAKLREVAEAFVATLTDNSRNEDRCLSFRHAELVDCISRARAELDKVKP